MRAASTAAGARLGRPRRPERAGTAADRMIVYGRNAVHEALRGSAYGQPGLGHHGTPHASRGSLRHPSSDRSRRPTRSLQRCGSDGHQGICAEVSEYHYLEAEALLRDGEGRRMIVALDQVQDPQNLGAICRSAECAGAAGLVLPERRAAEVTPAVCKASAGAVEHLPLAQVRNLTDFLQRRQGGVASGATALTASGPWTTVRSISVAPWCS